jgi:peptidylprolyl isomerase
MSERRLFGGLMAVGAAVIVAFYLVTRPEPAGQAVAATADAPGPYLVIEVAGEAEGRVVVDLAEETAPEHTARLTALAESGAYDDVVFHRVIDGFMAQTGDVEHGVAGGALSRAGTGGSDMPDLPAEFSGIPFQRGTVGMARAASPDSANSQFFIMFAPAPHLNGQYTVVGQVTEGMEVVDAIRRGTGPNGMVTEAPDRMARVTVER